MFNSPQRLGRRGCLLALLALGSSALLPRTARAISEELQPADEVLVVKSERRLYLLRSGRQIRSYRVQLGLNPSGRKQRAGDFRTPEGHYRLDQRNAASDFFLSIRLSYPNDSDRAQAQRRGWQPGGSIMIHGLPNWLKHPLDYYRSADWTDGCIALSNDDMLEVWLLTRANTPIEIRP